MSPPLNTCPLSAQGKKRAAKPPHNVLFWLVCSSLCRQVENRLQRGLRRGMRSSTPEIPSFLSLLPCGAKLPPAEQSAFVPPGQSHCAPASPKFGRFIPHLVCFQQRWCVHGHTPGSLGWGIKSHKTTNTEAEIPRISWSLAHRLHRFCPGSLVDTTGSDLQRDHHPGTGLQRASCHGTAPEGLPARTQGQIRPLWALRLHSHGPALGTCRAQSPLDLQIHREASP